MRYRRLAGAPSPSPVSPAVFVALLPELAVSGLLSVQRCRCDSPPCHQTLREVAAHLFLSVRSLLRVRALRQQMAGVLCSGLCRGRTCRAALCTSCASALLPARHSWTCLLAEVRICLLEARPACLPRGGGFAEAGSAAGAAQTSALPL